MKYIFIDNFQNSCNGAPCFLLHERFYGDKMRWYI